MTTGRACGIHTREVPTVKQAGNKPKGFAAHPENINRDGRPKKEKCITDALRRIAKHDLPEQLPQQWQKIVNVLEPLVGKPKTFADLLAFQMWWDSLDGNDRVAREIVDRLEGKTAQPLVGDSDFDALVPPIQFIGCTGPKANAGKGKA